MEQNVTKKRGRGSREEWTALVQHRTRAEARGWLVGWGKLLLLLLTCPIGWWVG